MPAWGIDIATTPGTWHAMQCDYDMWQAKGRFRAKVKPIARHTGRSS